jgi:hypothetical protein
LAKIVKVDGKDYKMARVVYLGNAGNMAVNVANIRGVIFDEEIATGRIVQFRSARDKKNEIYMELQTAVPAHISDGSNIWITRADPRGNYLETIWEGTYGMIPTGAGERINVNNLVVPVDEVRLDPTEHIHIELDSPEVIVVANSLVELRVQEFVHYRL